MSALHPTVATTVPPSLFGGCSSGDLSSGAWALLLALGGLDTGSSFGGLGSREMTISAIAEPALMLAIFTVALSANSTNLSEMARSAVSQSWRFLAPSQMLAFSGLFIVLIAETGRIPVDNPSTHLELTMIHEAMIPVFRTIPGLLEWGASIKQLVLMTLLVNTFFPFSLSPNWTASGLGLGLLFYLLLFPRRLHRAVETTNAKKCASSGSGTAGGRVHPGSTRTYFNVHFLRSRMSFIHDPQFGDRMITLMAALVLVLQISMVGQRWLMTNILHAIRAAVLSLYAIACTIAFFNQANHLTSCGVPDAHPEKLGASFHTRAPCRESRNPAGNRTAYQRRLSVLISGCLTLVGYVVAESFTTRGNPPRGVRHNTPIPRDRSVSDRLLHDAEPPQGANAGPGGCCPRWKNGLFLAAISLMYGMPLVVELRIFFDVLVAVMVLGILVHRIGETFD